MARQSLQGRTRSASQDRLCESAPQVIDRCLTTLFAPTAVGDTEGNYGFTTTSLFNGQLVIHDSRSKACCCSTLAMSQDRLCESSPLVMGYNLSSR